MYHDFNTPAAAQAAFGRLAPDVRNGIAAACRDGDIRCPEDIIALAWTEGSPDTPDNLTVSVRPQWSVDTILMGTYYYLRGVKDASADL